MRNVWLQIGQKHMTRERTAQIPGEERTCVERKLQKPKEGGNKSSGNWQIFPNEGEF